MSVFVLDVDGTICFDRATIAPRMLEILSKISASHQLVLASARHPADVEVLLPDALRPNIDIVGCNGAIGLRRGELCHCEPLDPDVVADVLAALESVECPYLAYGVDFVITGSAFHPFQDSIVSSMRMIPAANLTDPAQDCAKILCLPTTKQTALEERFAALAGTSVHSHEDGSFDVTASDVDKAWAVEALGHALPVFAAFGNDMNDLGILSQSQHSICVGSHSDLSRVAHHSVAGEQGVIDRLQELLKSLMS